MKSSRPRDDARALALAGIALLGVTGCSSGHEGEWGDAYAIMSQALGGTPPGVSMQDAAAIPFATIGIRLDNGAQGILVLATNNPEQQLWTSASHVVLLTQNGRILRTAGLPHNRTDIRLLSGSRNAPPLQGSAETRWEEDFGDLHLYSIPVTCHTIARGREGVKNFTSVIPTVHIDEECRAETIDWTFTNTYWISPKDGLTWRSIQYISPKLGPLEIDILRPPST
ncbi:MAG: YjbF family lipoprotein [Rhizomicrobium sp.]|jgi:hypothetical protein